MPLITFHKNGQTYQDEVKAGSNLVVRAGIKQYPYPHLAYQCGMGKCGHCQIGHQYVCIDGPVFNYWEAKNIQGSM